MLSNVSAGMSSNLEQLKAQMEAAKQSKEQKTTEQTGAESTKNTADSQNTAAESAKNSAQQVSTAAHNAVSLAEQVKGNAAAELSTATAELSGASAALSAAMAAATEENPNTAAIASAQAAVSAAQEHVKQAQEAYQAATEALQQAQEAAKQADEALKAAEEEAENAAQVLEEAIAALDEAIQATDEAIEEFEEAEEAYNKALEEAENSVDVQQVTSAGVQDVEEPCPMTEEEAIAAGYTIVRTVQDLQGIRDNLGEKFILMGDIDLSELDNWEPVGDEENPFTGVFNGNGHSISNLTIKCEDYDTSNIGLFGVIQEAVIKNLELQNAVIEGRMQIPWGDQATSNNVGLLAGMARGSIIDNITVTGSISSAEENVAGLIGVIDDRDYSHFVDRKTGYERVNIGTTKISNVNVNVDLEGRFSVSGLVSKINGDENDVVNIENCKTSGRAEVTSIYAAALLNHANCKVNLTNCSSDMSIIWPAGDIVDRLLEEGKIGGLTGTDPDENINLSGCSFDGTVNGETVSELKGSWMKDQWLIGVLPGGFPTKAIEGIDGISSVREEDRNPQSYGKYASYDVWTVMSADNAEALDEVIKLLHDGNYTLPADMEVECNFDFLKMLENGENKYKLSDYFHNIKQIVVNGETYTYDDLKKMFPESDEGVGLYKEAKKTNNLNGGSCRTRGCATSEESGYNASDNVSACETRGCATSEESGCNASDNVSACGTSQSALKEADNAAQEAAERAAVAGDEAAIAEENAQKAAQAANEEAQKAATECTPEAEQRVIEAEERATAAEKAAQVAEQKRIKAQAEAQKAAEKAAELARQIENQSKQEVKPSIEEPKEDIYAYTTEKLKERDNKFKEYISSYAQYLRAKVLESLKRSMGFSEDDELPVISKLEYEKLVEKAKEKGGVDKLSKDEQLAMAVYQIDNSILDAVDKSSLEGITTYQMTTEIDGIERDLFTNLKGDQLVQKLDENGLPLEDEFEYADGSGEYIGFDEIYPQLGVQKTDENGNLLFTDKSGANVKQITDKEGNQKYVTTDKDGNDVDYTGDTEKLSALLTQYNLQEAADGLKGDMEKILADIKDGKYPVEISDSKVEDELKIKVAI